LTKVEAQYTTEKKKYKKAAFGLQVRFEKRKKKKVNIFDCKRGLWVYRSLILRIG
jgi:hypothetical protein